MTGQQIGVCLCNSTSDLCYFSYFQKGNFFKQQWEDMDVHFCNPGSDLHWCRLLKENACFKAVILLKWRICKSWKAYNFQKRKLTSPEQIHNQQIGFLTGLCAILLVCFCVLHSSWPGGGEHGSLSKIAKHKVGIPGSRIMGATGPTEWALVVPSRTPGLMFR